MAFPSTLVPTTVAPIAESGWAAYDDAKGREFLPAVEGVSEASVATYALPSGMELEGTIAFRITPEWAGDDGALHALFRLGTEDDNYNVLKVQKGPNNMWAASYNDDGGYPVAVGSTDGIGAANLPHVVVARWKAGESLDICVDGIHRPQVALQLTSAAWPTLFVNPWLTDYPLASYVGPIIASNRRKPRGWVDAIMADEGVLLSDVLTVAADCLGSGDLLIPYIDSGNAYQCPSGPDFRDVLVVAGGDSMSTQLGACWSQMVLPKTWDVHSFSVGGYSIDQILAAQPAALAWASVQPQRAKVLVFQDMGSQRPDMSTKWVAYGQAAQAAGLKVIACTNSSNQSELVEPQSVATEWLRANYHIFADGLADIAADPTIGAEGAYNNGAYFHQDSLPHMTDAGNVISAGIIKAAIDGVLLQSADLIAKLDAVLLKTDTLGGAGGIAWPYTLTVNGMPCADAAVWVTSDEAGNNVVASGRTDDFGALVPVPKLDAGTYYFFAKKSGVNFSSPDIEVVA